MLRIGVLGRLSLELDGRALSPPAGRPARALLGWLALHPGRHARATVAAALWPDVLDESARSSLRVALVDLRRTLGPAADAALFATRDEVGLIDSPGVEVDARRFVDLLAAGDAEQALGLWRGELLAELDAGDWLWTLRDEYRESRSQALARLAEKAADPERALRFARERVTNEPLSEEATRDLMGRLAAAGDRAAALVAYGRLTDRLRSELRTAPSVPTRELAEAIRAGAPTTLPAAAPTGDRSAFVGRDGELRSLRRWLRERRRLVVIAGEPGAGKTRLAAELARVAAGDGTSILYGRCQREPLVSYEPFVEAARAHVGRIGAAAAAALAGDELGRLLPELRASEPEPPAGELADAARLRLFEGVRAVLQHAAGERGLLLVLDDLHWADRSTTMLLAYLARAPMPLTILAAYRPEELAREHPLPGVLADLAREAEVPVAQLSGLDVAATASIVAGLIGAHPDAGLVEHVVEQTRGNPFFVEQLARHLHESDALSVDARGARIRAAPAEVAPTGVRSLVRDRVARLGKSAAPALELAAICGSEFALAVLTRTRELERARLLDALEAAEAAGLIRAAGGARPGVWAFKHDLVRSALYEQLTEVRRGRLHSRIADALEQIDGVDPSELAHHAFAARGIDGPERAVRTSRLAAERALTALAYEEAAGHYRRALQALGEAEAEVERQRCELLLALGEAQARAADPEAGATFARANESARALADPELVARAALGRAGIGVTIVGLDTQRADALQEALDMLGGRDSALRSRLLARLAIQLYYAPGRTRAGPLAGEAVQLARTSGDHDALLAALSAQHVALWTPDGLRERLAVAAEMISLARAHERPEQELQGRHWLCADLWEAGEIDRFERETAAHAQLAAHLRLPTYRWYGPLWQAALAGLRANWEQAERLVAEAEQAGVQAGDRNATLFASGLRLSMRLTRHQFADEDLEIAEGHIRQSPASPAWRCLRCWFAAQAGNLDQANADLDWLANDHFARLPRDANWLPALFELTEAVFALGDTTRAAETYDLILPFQDQHLCAMRGAVSWGSAHGTLGKLATTAGRLDDAGAHYRAALELEQEWGAQAWLTRTRARYADLLLQHGGPGDRETALALARDAVAQAQTLQLSPNLITPRVRHHAVTPLQPS